MDIDISKLKGRHVYLELLREEHREIIRLLAKDERIWEYTKGLLIDDKYDKMYDSYFDLASDRQALGGQQSFVIKQITNNKIIGMTRLYEFNPRDKSVLIGYTWYIPAVWGKVYNKECKLLLLRYIFEVLQFTRAEFRVAHQNIRSQKAVEKIGGIKEGTLRKHGYRNDGSVRHTVIFSIIDDEWLCVKENLLRLITGSEND